MLSRYFAFKSLLARRPQVLSKFAWASTVSFNINRVRIVTFLRVSVIFLGFPSIPLWFSNMSYDLGNYNCPTKIIVRHCTRSSLPLDSTAQKVLTGFVVVAFVSRVAMGPDFTVPCAWAGSACNSLDALIFGCVRCGYDKAIPIDHNLKSTG